MAQLEYICFAFLPISVSSSPYVTIYTKPSAGSANWYGAKVTLDTYNTPLTAFTQTYAYGSISGSSTLSVPTIPGYSSVQMTQNGANNVGTWSPTDQVLYIVFNAGNTGTIAPCPAGSVELILHEVNVITPTGTISNKFSNDSVINMYTAQSVSAIYAYLFDSNNSVPPPVTNHSGFTTDPTAIYMAKHNYSSTDGHVMATYIPL
jgi:hypothetical protein